jgi:hypothetical protein
MGAVVLNFEDKLKDKWLEKTGYIRVEMFEEGVYQYIFRFYYGDYGAQIALDEHQVIHTSLPILQQQHEYWMMGVMSDIQKL